MQAQGSTLCYRNCKQTHTTPQAQKSTSQPYVHKAEVTGTIGRVEDISFPSIWNSCLKDNKNKLVNIAVYRNRNNFCFQRPLIIQVWTFPRLPSWIPSPKSALANDCDIRVFLDWEFLKHQRIQFYISGSVEGRIFRTLKRIRSSSLPLGS